MYGGPLFPAWASSIPTGAFIDWPSFYPPYAIQINYREPWSADETTTKQDPRFNHKILQVLEEYEQLHSGLSCRISDITIQPDGKVTFEIVISNEDSFNYYILNPEKMGTGLYHYFTNGLIFYNKDTGWLKHQEAVQSPDPWDYWGINWLELIESNTERAYTITYNAFDPIPAGTYEVFFQFPGLHNVDQFELHRINGRIWLGGIDTEYIITIE